MPSLHRNQQSMGNRYLEVFEGKRSEYYAAVASVSSSFSLILKSCKFSAKTDTNSSYNHSNIITGMALVGVYWATTVRKNKQVRH